jgi:mannose-1-phosphate guanylyltransferase / mannose-6-phosphate isomerase
MGDETLIIPVILCGGAGTRLWPLSRENAPKQFLPLIDGRSTFAMTLERIADRDLFGPPLIIANEKHRFLIGEALRVAGVEGEILLEPMRRDSAAAIASAASLVAKRDPDALLLVLAADHVVRDSAGFRQTVEIAIAAVETDHIVTFGVKPDTPSTSYGYIRPGAADPASPRVAEVVEFAEKPDAATAARYVEAGYLWNSGNFMLRAGFALDEFARHEPAVATAVAAAVEGIEVSPSFSRLPSDLFEAIPAISFDYAVMERTDRAVVVEAGFDWCDIGGWEALKTIAGSDDDGNTVIGDVVVQDTRGSHIVAAKGTVGVLGVDNLVVATSGDAVLVAARDKIDQVKGLVSEIEANRSGTEANGPVVRPWGYFLSIESGEGYQVKRLVVEPGARLSLQKHAHRAEHWVVVSGVADVTVGTETKRLEENQSTYIPLGGVHRLANPGKDLLTVIEVQYGDYLGEDDIVRLQDDFDRPAED